ncbi:MAG: hypothetical protein KBH07_13380 [Flavobacteriales bacterium]|nr:hypothetical protein [Flavobacteriales bacterium]MBP9079240.1 hypothetical protein [Flavobacteriales bacterium]
MSIGDNAYWDGLDYTLPTQLPNGDPLPPDAFYHNYGMAFLASFDVASLHLDYCTGWGQGTALNAPDLQSAAYGLDYDGGHLWMVGGTHALALTNTDCPDPGGTGVHHTPANNGGMDDHAKCDGFILAFDPATYQLKYGTLLGGYNYDMLLDVAHDADHIYITGETRSNTHYTTDLDADRYFQPLNPNGSSRDAVIIALAKNMASPTLLWQTPFGGSNSERGWGIAANATELYLTGGTASSTWDTYPLKEFNPDDDLDFYQNIHFGGNAYSFLDYCQFEYGLDGSNGTPSTNPEPDQQPHDGFIASFDLQYQNTVGTAEPPAPAPHLVVNPLPVDGRWEVRFPGPGHWTVPAYHAGGQTVGSWHTSDTPLVVDLSARPQGLYLLVATTAAGARYTAKVVRP